MTSPVLLRMTAPSREDFDIPYRAFGDPAAPLRLALVAGLHGNELNGIFVLVRLGHFLEQIAAGKRPDVRLRQRVIVVPAVNVLGVNVRSRTWPFDNTDVNRMFPGYHAGETTQRVAHALLELTRQAACRIDIHSSNLDFEELPQVRLYDPSDEERHAARLLGLPAVIERTRNTIFASTLASAWRAHGGVSLVVQAGQAGALQTGHCERLFRSLVGFLEAAGVLEGVSLAEPDDVVHCFGPRRTLPVLADHAGWFISRLEVGQWVQAGDPIGYVYDGFEGSLRSEIRAPASGLLSGIRRQPLLFEGDLIARLQTQQDVGEVTETFLYGHGQ